MCSVLGGRRWRLGRRLGALLSLHDKFADSQISHSFRIVLARCDVGDKVLRFTPICEVTPHSDKPEITTRTPINEN